MSLNECPHHLEEYPAGSFCTQCAEERAEEYLQRQYEISIKYTKKVIKNGDKIIPVYTQLKEN